MTTPLPRLLLPLLLVLMGWQAGCGATFEPVGPRGILQVLVDPAHPEVLVGGETWLTATALCADGTAQDVTDEVEWSLFSGDQFVAIAGTQSSNTRLIGIEAGHAQLFAVLDDVVSEVVVVEITEEPSLPGGGAYPDLGVLQFDAAVVGGHTTYAVDVVNDGDAVAGGFWVDLFRNPEEIPEPWDVGDAYVWIEALAPGEVAYLDIEVELTPLAGAPWQSFVLVDGYEMVVEHYEGDNLAGPLEVE